MYSLEPWWWTERPPETCIVSLQNKINLIHWCIWLVLLASKQTEVSVWQMPVALCTVVNCWWWTERPSETCRVSLQNKRNSIHWCIWLVLLWKHQRSQKVRNIISLERITIHYKIIIFLLCSPIYLTASMKLKYPYRKMVHRILENIRQFFT